MSIQNPKICKDFNLYYFKITCSQGKPWEQEDLKPVQSLCPIRQAQSLP